jgi:hypothetical protein
VALEESFASQLQVGSRALATPLKLRLLPMNFRCSPICPSCERPLASLAHDSALFEGSPLERLQATPTGRRGFGFSIRSFSPTENSHGEKALVGGEIKP